MLNLWFVVGVVLLFCCWVVGLLGCWVVGLLGCWCCFVVGVILFGLVWLGLVIWTIKLTFFFFLKLFCIVFFFFQKNKLKDDVDMKRKVFDLASEINVGKRQRRHE